MRDEPPIDVQFEVVSEPRPALRHYEKLFLPGGLTRLLAGLGVLAAFVALKLWWR